MGRQRERQRESEREWKEDITIMWRYCGWRCCRHFVTLIITIISCSVLSLPTAVDSQLPRVGKRGSERERERGSCQPTLMPTWVVTETEIALIKCALLLPAVAAVADVADVAVVVVAIAMTAFEVLLNCIAVPFITPIRRPPLSPTHYRPIVTLDWLRLPCRWQNCPSKWIISYYWPEIQWQRLATDPLLSGVLTISMPHPPPSALCPLAISCNCCCQLVRIRFHIWVNYLIGIESAMVSW